MGWIEEIVAQGIRRPGYAADQWAEQWAAGLFGSFGLDEVHLEPVELSRWEPILAELKILPDGPRFKALQLPYTAKCEVEAELVMLDEEGEAAGCIGVAEHSLGRFRQTVARSMATAAYDPDGDFEWLEQILPIGTNPGALIEKAVERKAEGFVGLLTGFPWETHDYYVPYDAIARPIPGIWLSGEDGRRLLELMASGGPQRARLVADAEAVPTATHNVIGSLPGATEEWVIVASHHDGPWSSAVEDAGGVALVLAQAAYWASVEQADLPHNMLFLLTSGHMHHAAGTRSFIETHREFLEEVVLEIHLEHPARRCLAEAGELVVTDEPEVRWWFTSRNPNLEAAVEKSLGNEDLRRSLILKPDVFSPMPPTDAAFFHPAGVPLVSFLTAPMYLFDSQDTIDKIHEESLEPISRAVIQIIESTRGETAAGIRAGVISP